jgi:hypothetical protein
MALLGSALTPDAELLKVPDPRLMPADSGESRISGRANLIAHFAETRAAFDRRGEIPRHIFSNLMIDEEGFDLVRTRAHYLLLVQSVADGTVLIGASTQYNELVRSLDGWLIRSHRLVLGHMAGYDRLSTRP